MRHWIVGSGKSLHETPLEEIAKLGEPMWGMNRIHLFYPYTAWRADRFVMLDHNMHEDMPTEYWKSCIAAHWEKPKWLLDDFRFGVLEGAGQPWEYHSTPIPDVPNVTWTKRCEHSPAPLYPSSGWHDPVCTGWATVSAVMQLAAREASEIVLLGMDLFGEDYSDNHFDPTYSPFGAKQAKIDNEYHDIVHKMAKKDSPVPIYNGTVGGNLEVHERIDVFEVLK